MKTTPAALLGLLVAVAGCDIKVGQNGVSVDIADGSASDEWARTYTLSPGGHFEIVNVNGAIHATPSSGPQVEVVARREVRAQNEETSRALLQKIEMVEDVAADRVKVEAKADWEQTSGTFGRRPQATVEYRVGVPPGLSVHLKTENGAVRLENVRGAIVAASTNGGVNARGLEGSLRASTVNGGINVDLASVTGDVEIVTVNGGVRLELPADVNAMLDARAVNGGVTVDEQITLEATDRARLHVAGRLNGGGPKISVQTTNGGVRVSVRAPSPPPPPPLPPLPPRG